MTKPPSKDISNDSWEAIHKFINEYPCPEEKQAAIFTTIEWLWVNYLCNTKLKKHKLQVFSMKKALENASTLLDWIQIADYSKTNRKRAFAEIEKFDISNKDDIELLCHSRSLRLMHIGLYLRNKQQYYSENRKLQDETSKILKSTIGKNTRICEFCTIHDAIIGDNCLILERISIKKAVIGAGSDINAGTYIENAIIGENVQIAMNCCIPGVTHNFSKDGIDHKDVFKKIIIGDGAWIGAGSIILPGIKIGKGAIVGAGATVSKDVPDHYVYVGIPIIKSTFRLYPIE